ncbi:MAG: hypothetical protein AAFU64_14415, partial [Bacteroidota bacterium]
MAFDQRTWARWQFIWQLLLFLLMLGGVLLVYAYHSSRFPLLFLSLLALAQLVSLVRSFEKPRQQLLSFLEAITYDDFTWTFPQARGSRRDPELGQAFEQVMEKFRDIRAEREAQFQYLSTLIEYIEIGILVLDQDKKINFINPSARALLNLPRAHHLDLFARKYPDFLKWIIEKPGEEKALFHFPHLQPGQQLSIRRNSLKIRDEILDIISIQDIQSELEDKEMEAWQGLIRVLTHEIINSVTPIASLSATLKDDLAVEIKNSASEDLQDYYDAIRSIHRRSEGLIHFVQDFRNLSKIPQPQKRLISVKEMLGDILQLIQEEMKKANITYTISILPPNLHLSADAHLVEQVLINLLKNAIQALEGKESKLIQIKG